MRKQYQKKHRKNASKIEFWPPCWPPKSSEILPKSDAERSLFRDAMEIARASSEINGTHGLYSVQMARHMIRSTPSIDLPLVALIIKVSSATCNAYNHCLPSQNQAKIPKNRQKNTKKSK